MSAVTHLLDAPHPPRVSDREACDALNDVQTYEALSEAADLVTKAGRLLRRVHQPALGFRLSDIADEIHTEIRRGPYQPAAPWRSHLPRTLKTASDPPSS